MIEVIVRGAQGEGKQTVARLIMSVLNGPLGRVTSLPKVRLEDGDERPIGPKDCDILIRTESA